MRVVKQSLVLLVILLFCVSCAGFVANTYKSLYITGTSYDVAMKTVAGLQAQGKITSEQRANINQLANYVYVSYQASVDAFGVYKKTESSESKQALVVALSSVSANWSKMAGYVNRIAPGSLAATLEEVAK